MRLFGRTRAKRRLRRWLLHGLLALLLVQLVPIALFRWVPPPTTAFMLQARHGGLGDAPACRAVDYRWADWAAISGHAKLAVVASEDQRFPQHWGLDVGAIQDAVADGIGSGRIRGASTITQQLAKNLFLWPERSWLRKGLDAYLAVLLELGWTKQRILEVYLNTAQFGACTFGVEAAAQRFYGRSAAELDARQAALLAAVLPNPRVLRAHRPSAYLEERAAWIQTQMKGLGGPPSLADL